MTSRYRRRRTPVTCSDPGGNMGEEAAAGESAPGRSLPWWTWMLVGAASAILGVAPWLVTDATRQIVRAAVAHLSAGSPSPAG